MEREYDAMGVAQFSDGIVYRGGDLLTFHRIRALRLAAATGAQIRAGGHGLLDDRGLFSDLSPPNPVDGVIGRDAIGPGEKSTGWIEGIEPPVNPDEHLLGRLERILPVAKHPDQHGKDAFSVTPIEVLESTDISGEVPVHQAAVFIILLHIHISPRGTPCLGGRYRG